MNNRTKVLILVLTIIALATGSAVLGIYHADHPYVTYEGTEVFGNQEDYATFKWDIVTALDAGSTMPVMKVLSSDPPIVAEYIVHVPKSYELPYGEKHIVSSYYVGLMVFVLVGASISVPMLSIFWPKRKAQEQAERGTDEQ